MRVGSKVSLGAAQLEVLSPDAATRTKAMDRWRKGKRFDANRTATAVLVEWGPVRLVLGSDLIEKPGKEWSSAISRAGRGVLARHDALKVPHHGSTKALHSGLLRRPARAGSPV